MKAKTILFMLLIVSALVAYILYGKRQNQSTQQMPPAAKPQVEVITLNTTKTPRKIVLNGRVVAFQSSQVRPQVSGIIEAKLFTEGALVEKGQPLYQLDDARFEANLSSVQAQLESARAQHLTVKQREKRLQALSQSQAVSQQDLDDVKASLAQAVAQISVAQSVVELAELDMEYSQIKAPISGRISQSLFTAGALVTANQAQHLAIITQLDPVYVDLQASNDMLRQIQKELLTKKVLPVQLNDHISDSVSQTGEISFADVNVDSSTGAVTIRAIFANPSGYLLPGLFVTAEVNLGEIDAVLIPQRATSRTPNGDLMIWLVDDQGIVSSQIVFAHGSEDNQWVVGDLSLSGQSLIVTGYHRLQNGVEVQASHWQSSSTEKQ